MEYICDLCGFSYSTDQRGPMPEDYHCPICGGDRTHFLPEDAFPEARSSDGPNNI